MFSIHSPDPAAPQRFAYRGGSMRGTFRNGDCLWVDAAPYDALALGDVVAYREDEKTVSHRIVGQTPSGWLTQGDANRRPDRGVLRAEGLIGRVVTMERAGARRPVVGGAAGLRRARWLHVRARLRRWVYACLAPLYRLLRATHLARLIWHPRVLRLRLATATVGAPDEYCIKYLVRGRTAARWFPSKQRWLCRKPYDLVLMPPALTRGASLVPSLASRRPESGGYLESSDGIPDRRLRAARQ